MRRSLAALTTAAALLAAASAHATVSVPPVAGTWIYHSTDSTDGDGNPRCGDVYGVQWPVQPQATAYTVDYFDGYYNAEEQAGNTAQAFRAESTFEPANLLFHGITGGNGPGPCQPQAPDDGGRFTKIPHVYGTFPAGYLPPLNAFKSTAKPKTAAAVTIRAAKGTFQVSDQVYVEVVLKATGGSLINPKPGYLRFGSGKISLSGPTGVTIIGHKSAIFQGMVTVKGPGTVPLSASFTARTKSHKLVTVKATSSLTFG